MRKITIIRFLFAMVLLVQLFMAGCINESEIENYPAVSFSSEVQPIIAANCTQSGCHGTTNTEKFVLLSYNDIINHVTPGNGRKSSIYRTITGRSEDFMPPSPSAPLTEDQIRSIFVWIEQGAPNN